MDQTELSLGPSLSSFPDSTNSSSSESEANNHRKRKLSSWAQPNSQISIDLQLNNPLPLDWEQCLDLKSGRMYYLNRKTLKKSSLKPKEQKLDLDLNISNLPNSEHNKDFCFLIKEDTKKQNNCNNGGSSAMVAVVCLNCHLLVMMSSSSPSCPNCKHMHLLLPSSTPKKETVKSLETLSLLH